MEKTYSLCKACGDIVYRIKGHRHGDGQVDTDKNQVWLLSDERSAKQDGVDIDSLPEIFCGCND